MSNGIVCLGGLLHILFPVALPVWFFISLFILTFNFIKFQILLLF